ncbi:octanoyltransferase [Saccharothrix sp. NRRL B-16348]|uniref:lipoyl(octanoyl) transferase LipB n=1 Tax=Saccharothrix sp. NRRL B-16348 TaxID=1415542 RepID=UPI0006AF7ADA|nr:lipoyl(octanoyl) transferase LipB [Saccharothrix sp. NRRL B-16348]KOX18825.1 octanoyltransferase [Saccharothrix sp. NRRL B-16348]
MRFVHGGFGRDAVPYEQAYAEQRRLHALRVADEIGDVCVLQEHLPVYTAGKRTKATAFPTDDVPVLTVDRGGEITWHGPGQLVGYPVVKLPVPLDSVGHVRRLEDALIGTCAEFGVATARLAGRSGVWVLGADEPAPDVPPSAARAHGQHRKIAAIGVRIERCTSLHGFGLNCDPDLTPFDRIVPCGIEDAGVTSLSAELGRRVAPAEVVPVVERHLTRVFAADRR